MFEQGVVVTFLRQTAFAEGPKRRTASEASAEPCRTGAASAITKLAFRVTAGPPRADSRGAGARRLAGRPIPHPPAAHLRQERPRPALRHPPRGRGEAAGPVRAAVSGDRRGLSPACPAAPPAERPPAPGRTLQAARGSVALAPPTHTQRHDGHLPLRYLRRKRGPASPRPARRRLLLADLLLQLLEHGGGREMGGEYERRRGPAARGEGYELPGRLGSASRGRVAVVGAELRSPRPRGGAAAAAASLSWVPPQPRGR